MIRPLLVLVIACLPSSLRGDDAKLAVRADFEGGSAEIASIDPATGTIRLSPAGHKDRGWNCWWYLKVTGITPGQTITLDLGASPLGPAAMWAMPHRAMYSTDNKTWRYTGEGKKEGNRITYAQQVDAKEAWFAWGPPFTPTHARELVERIAKASPHARAFELCKTRGERGVPALRIREGHDKEDDGKRFGVWIQARQHAWESGSSWVCAGLVEWLVSDDGRAAALRKSCEIVIVPIMDIDNTAIGAGGKEQKPQDHNRDWSDDPHHASVKAAQAHIAKWNEASRFDLFIDLHNPGPADRKPFYFTAPAELLNSRGKRNLERFLAAGKAEITGPLKLADKPRESGPSYDKNWQKISKNWVTKHTSDHVVAVTLETSWNTPHSTIEGYMRVGREQGLAIERYLRASPRE